MNRDYEIRPLAARDIPIVIDMVSSIFSRLSPVDRWLGTSAAAITHHVGETAEALVGAELSFVAVHRPSSTLAAFMLSEPFTSPIEPPDAFAGLPDYPIFDVLFRLEKVLEQYVAALAIPHAQVLHLVLSGCVPEHQRHGLTEHMKARTNDAARARGHVIAFAETANLVSQHLNRKVGFEDVFAIDLERYVEPGSGRRPFAGISGAPAPATRHFKLMVRDLRGGPV